MPRYIVSLEPIAVEAKDAEEAIAKRLRRLVNAETIGMSVIGPDDTSSSFHRCRIDSVVQLQQKYVEAKGGSNG